MSHQDFTTKSLSGAPLQHADLPPVRPQKASDLLAAELRNRIVGGEYAIGEMLPPERELSETTEVSRATVREALRILEVQELVRIRPGRGGGAAVRQPSSRLVADSLNMLIRSHGVELKELLEARQAMEPAGAMLAAQHRTDDDIEAIEAAHEVLLETVDGPHEAYNKANVDWHRSVIQASHNIVLTSVMRALSPSIQQSTEMESILTKEVRSETSIIHGKITEAICRGDAEAARRRMGRHVSAAGEVLIEHVTKEF